MKELLFFISVALFFSSCEDNYVPKPRGYFRIDLPEKKYLQYSSDCPFAFEYPDYARVVPYQGNRDLYCSSNIEFYRFKGSLHLSYFKLNNDLTKHIEDSRTLVYKHTVRAEAIDEQVVSDVKDNKYGLVYNIAGNAASSIQFYLTDSANHFLRGALYFNVPPNSDSIAPVENFIKADIYHLLKTLQWK